jgi:hypothetical protein
MLVRVTPAPPSPAAPIPTEAPKPAAMTAPEVAATPAGRPQDRRNDRRGPVQPAVARGRGEHGAGGRGAARGAGHAGQRERHAALHFHAAHEVQDFFNLAKEAQGNPSDAAQDAVELLVNARDVHNVRVSVPQGHFNLEQ